MQHSRRCIQRCCHKGQFAPGLFRVVGMFHQLSLLVCMWMQFALHMQLFSDGLFFTNDVRRSFDYSTVGWTLQRRRFRLQRCCFSPEVVSPAAAHLCCCLLVCLFYVSPFQRPIIPLCLHSSKEKLVCLFYVSPFQRPLFIVCLFYVSPFQRPIIPFPVLSPAHLQHGIPECRGDSGGGF